LKYEASLPLVDEILEDKFKKIFEDEEESSNSEENVQSLFYFCCCH